MKSLVGFIFIVTLLIVAGCDQNPECNQSTLAGVKFSFVKNTHYQSISLFDTLFNADSTAYELSFRKDTAVAISRPSGPVWFHAAGNALDTVYSTDEEALQVLPLTAGITSQSYIVNYGDEQDEIRFNYSEELMFLDIPCGFIATFTLDSIAHTTNIIDSIQFLSTEADNDVSTENITIYYY